MPTTFADIVPEGIFHPRRHARAREGFPARFALRASVPIGHHVRAGDYLVLIREGFPARFALRASVPIGHHVRAGDYLVLMSHQPRAGDFAGVRRASIHQLPRSAFAAIAAAVDTFTVADNPWQDIGRHPWEALLSHVRMSRARHPNATTRSSRLFVLRPVLEDVSEPIKAGSDQAALFELIASAGGRLA